MCLRVTIKSGGHFLIYVEIQAEVTLILVTLGHAPMGRPTGQLQPRAPTLPSPSGMPRMGRPTGQLRATRSSTPVSIGHAPNVTRISVNRYSCFVDTAIASMLAYELKLAWVNNEAVLSMWAIWRQLPRLVAFIRQLCPASMINRLWLNLTVLGHVPMGRTTDQLPLAQPAARRSSPSGMSLMSQG